MRNAAGCALVVFLAACGSGSPVMTMDVGGVSDTANGELVRAADVFVDIRPREEVDILWTDPDVLPWDVELTEVEAGPAPGEAGYPCKEGSDCNEGYCIVTPEGKQCTMHCEEECPFGWLCLQYTPSLPDQLFLCAPVFMELCTPCQANSDCMTNGVDSGQKCVDYGPEGYFCGGHCDEETSCPPGYSCVETLDITGATTTQCRSDAATCQCSQLAIDAGAWTECYVANEWGTCKGERHCMAEGLTACPAATPAQETCNGNDDNCDGQVDEELSGGECLVTGQYGACPGTLMCIDGVEKCEGTAAAAEKCDGLDNNCDGQTDEGFPDTDGDGTADCLETDKDSDGIPDGLDNCPSTFNPGQTDTDYDTVGDVCDPDDDNDLVPDGQDCASLDVTVHPGAEEICDGKDNDCNYIVDEGFMDTDGDGWKDCVDDDSDGDGAPDEADCAPLNADAWPGAPELCDGLDNDCDFDVDEGYPDGDGDGLADCADPDLDDDGLDNGSDNCPAVPNTEQADQDADGIGDKCDADLDGDSVTNLVDNCPSVANTTQGNVDGDGAGDACDDDLDGDGTDNGPDNCPLIANGGQEDADDDGIGDACEDDSDGDGAPDIADCAPLDAAAYPGAQEVCDGIDNNCNYSVDEGFPDADADGLKNCVDGDDDGDGEADEADCAPLNASIHPLAAEVCDGKDNDCDDKIDEEQPVLACGKGACFHSVASCSDGVVQVCDPLEGIAYEECDAVDNDCDGLVDEDLGTTTCGFGACQHTVGNCQGGETVACDPTEGAGPEECDGMDNDCDGKVDEDLGQTSCGQGQCFHTVSLCQGGVLTECAPFAGALPESCDGLDNDCDGDGDEDLGSTTCGLGECEHTVDNCLDGVPQMCNPLVGVLAESCDGLDNNCDGTIDDGFDDIDGDGAADCIDDDDDGDGDPDDTDCASLDETIGHTQTEVCFNDIDEDCDGDADPDTECLFASCDALHGAYPEQASGAFTIDPDGDGPVDSLEVLCDMVAAGGGWTVIDEKIPHGTGLECALAEVTEQGVIRLTPQNCCHGSGSHGGCGFWTTVKLPYQEIRVSDFSAVLNNCGSVNFNNPRVTAFKNSPQSPDNYHYPGWNPECEADCDVVWTNNHVDGLGDGTWDTEDAEPKYIHFGVGGFSTCLYMGTARLMVR